MLKDPELTHICFDLMYGLPYQGEDQLAATIKLATSLRPSRVALFENAHVPWIKNTNG
jgi:oxygen-independent coproporphyrinogen-3 oxidase